MIGEEQADQEANQYTYEDGRKSNRPSVIGQAHALSREPGGLQMLDVEGGLVVLLDLLGKPRQPVRCLLWLIRGLASSTGQHALCVALKDLLQRRGKTSPQKLFNGHVMIGQREDTEHQGRFGQLTQSCVLVKCYS